jgi:hypothetical protein
VKRLHRIASIIVFNTLLLFVALNVAAWIHLRSEPRPFDDAERFFSTEERLDAMRALYPGRTDSEIRELFRAPGVTSHPVLEYMNEPFVGRDYEVGPENIRLDRFSRERDPRRLLDGSTWVLGGSTTFGYGVAGDETIVAYLNELGAARGERFVNLGVLGAHEGLEIDKLILLLKKGYRPKRVVLFDGLNDFYAITSSNFAPEETPADRRHAYGLHYSARILDQRARWVFAADAFPLLHLVRQWTSSSTSGFAIVDHGIDDIYAPRALYHRDPDLHLRALALSYDEKFRLHDRYAQKLIRYHRANLDVLSGLARGFGFEWRVFYQPIGSLNRKNPFIRDPARYLESGYYRLQRSLVDAVEGAIEARELPEIIDLTRADEPCGECYIDSDHYAPKLNRILAGAILDRL